MKVTCIGILVGGKGSRLGGVAKGLLPTPSHVSIIEHLLAEIDTAAPEASVFLLGSRPEYAHLKVPVLEDQPSNIGPLGGLGALLRTASDEVVLLGCDMPFISAALLRRLLSPACKTAIATKSDGEHFEPLFARFNLPATVPVVERRIAQGCYSLQGVLVELGAETLPLTQNEAAQLRDWDTPEDMVAG